MTAGVVGLALCFFLVFEIRRTASQLEREVPENLEHIEQVAQSVRQQGEAATKVLESTRERVGFLGESIEQLSKKLSDRNAASSLFVVIDQDIDMQLNNARQFVLSMQNSMRNLGSTLLVFDSMSIFGGERFQRPGTAGAGREENPVRSVAVGLTQTADLLDQVTRAITKLQSGESISPIQLGQIQYTLKRVDLELNRIKSEVSQFSGEVAETEAKFTKMKQNAPSGIRYVSNIVSLFLFCFGFAQLMLCGYGLQLVGEARRSRASAQRLS
jgi:hypothetical protein